MKTVVLFALAACSLVFLAAPAEAKTKAHRSRAAHFTYHDTRSGQFRKADVIDSFRGRIVPARFDPRLDKRMLAAASIAQERARAHSKSRCWHYVKDALLASGAVNSRPKSVYAKQAGDELVQSYGFKKLAIRNPYQAPVGAVLVYGARRAAGHVEIRTKTGFVSDFRNREPSRRPLIGVYAKI